MPRVRTMLLHIFFYSQPYGTKLRKKLRSNLRRYFDRTKLRSKLGVNFFLIFDEKIWHEFNLVLRATLYPCGR
jgi:hypothetical protein